MTTKELEGMTLPELSDRCTELWFNYTIATSAAKKKIADEYNATAEYYNERAGWKCMSYITATTKPESRIEKNQHPMGAEPMAESKTDKHLPGLTAGHKQVRQKSGGSIIQQILALHIAGKTNKEIIDAGFNKSTVSRQVSEYKKLKK